MPLCCYDFQTIFFYALLFRKRIIIASLFVKNQTVMTIKDTFSTFLHMYFFPPSFRLVFTKAFSNRNRSLSLPLPRARSSQNSTVSQRQERFCFIVFISTKCSLIIYGLVVSSCQTINNLLFVEDGVIGSSRKQELDSNMLSLLSCSYSAPVHDLQGKHHARTHARTPTYLPKPQYIE